MGSGLLVSFAGLLVLGFTSSATVSVLLIVVGFSLVGLGNGQTTAPSTTLIMGSVPRAKSGVGSAVNDLSREMGGALGIAVLGSLLASMYRSNIVSRLASVPVGVREQARGSIVDTFNAAASAGRSGNRQLAELLTEQGKAAFGHAFGQVMLIAAGVILLNAAIVWIFQSRREPDQAEA